MSSPSGPWMPCPRPSRHWLQLTGAWLPPHDCDVWTEEELADWEDTYAKCLSACEQANLDDQLRSVFHLAQQDHGQDELERISSEMESAFLQYSDPRFLNKGALSADGLRPLEGILYYLAGTEVDPFVPVEAWACGIAAAEVTPQAGSLRGIKKKAINFGDCSGYSLGRAAERLYEIAQDDPDLDQRPGYEEVYKAAVLDSIHLAKTALPQAVRSDAFRELPKRTPFHFWVTPGHDEPSIWLLSVEGA